MITWEDDRGIVHDVRTAWSLGELCHSIETECGQEVWTAQSEGDGPRTCVVCEAAQVMREFYQIRERIGRLIG